MEFIGASEQKQQQQPQHQPTPHVFQHWNPQFLHMPGCHGSKSLLKIQANIYFPPISSSCSLIRGPFWEKKIASNCKHYFRKSLCQHRNKPIRRNKHRWKHVARSSLWVFAVAKTTDVIHKHSFSAIIWITWVQITKHRISSFVFVNLFLFSYQMLLIFFIPKRNGRIK